MYRFFIPVIFLVTVSGCNSGDDNGRVGQSEKNVKSRSSSKLQHLSWLKGSWIMQHGEAAITEVWTSVADTIMMGNSSVVNKQGDTMMTEKITLLEQNDTLFYIPAVSNQNSGQPVRFKELSFSDTMVSFENLQHDYPQRIIYRKFSDTEIEARIEGTDQGKATFDVFHYKRSGK
jgi:hypothetical protein